MGGEELRETALLDEPARFLEKRPGAVGGPAGVKPVGAGLEGHSFLECVHAGQMNGHAHAGVEGDAAICRSFRPAGCGVVADRLEMRVHLRGIVFHLGLAVFPDCRRGERSTSSVPLADRPPRGPQDLGDRFGGGANGETACRNAVRPSRHQTIPIRFGTSTRWFRMIFLPALESPATSLWPPFPQCVTGINVTLRNWNMLRGCRDSRRFSSVVANRWQGGGVWAAPFPVDSVCPSQATVTRSLRTEQRILAILFGKSTRPERPVPLAAWHPSIRSIPVQCRNCRNRCELVPVAHQSDIQFPITLGRT